MSNWYAIAKHIAKSLTVTAASDVVHAVEIINKLRLARKSNKLFIHRHWKLVDWEEGNGGETISNETDLENYIKRSMIPEVLRRMDKNFPDNNYVKEVDLNRFFEYAMNEPVVQNVYAIFQKDPQMAKQMMLDSFNESKETIFQAWSNILLKKYDNDPSFVFMMLDQMFDSSPPDTRTVVNVFPFSLDGAHKILDSTEDKNLQQFNLWKTYRKHVNETNCAGLEAIPNSKDGWVPIDGHPENSEQFELDINRLTGFAIGNGWCFGNDYTARSYLLSKNFYILVRNKNEAFVAMEYSRDNRFVFQIKGRNNSVPHEFCREIRDLIYAKGLNTSQSRDWQILKKNFKLEEDLKDPEFYAKYIKSIESNYQNFSAMPVEYRSNPDAIAAAAIGYAHYLDHSPKINPKNLNPAPTEVENSPVVKNAKINHWISWIRELDVSRFQLPKVDEIPDEIRHDPRLKSAMVEPYLRWIKKSPEVIFDCPDFVSEMPEAKEAFQIGVNKWRDKLLRCQDVKRFWEENDPETIPQRVRLLPQIQSVYRNLLRRQEVSTGRLKPKDINSLQDELAVRPSIIQNIGIDPDYFKKELSPDQQQDPYYRAAWAESWANRLESVGEHLYGPLGRNGVPVDIPKELKDLPRIKSAQINGWINLIELVLSRQPDRLPKLLTICPLDIKNQIKNVIDQYPGLKKLEGRI